MDAIFKLLKLEMKLAVALISLVLGVLLWLLRPLIQRVWSAAADAPQPMPQPAPKEAPVAPVRAAQIRAHQADAMRQPPPTALAGGPLGTPVQQVLRKSDHTLYITRTSDWIIVHPDSARLLEMVDRMGVIALYRDGAPFMEAAPDMSGPAVGELGVPQWADADFLESEGLVPLPAADGKLWVRSAGGYRHLVTGLSSP